MIGFKKLLRWFCQRSHGNKLVCGRGVRIGLRSKFSAKTAIGDYSRTMESLRTIGYQDIQIGKFCALGSNITIISTNHQTCKANLQVALQRKCGFSSLIKDGPPVIIGNNVWIGDNVTILPGVSISDGAVVGAGSVVTKDIPAFAIVAGIPASVIKMRFSDEIIDELLMTKWWQWPIQKIKGHKDFFNADLSSVTPDELKQMLIKV